LKEQVIFLQYELIKAMKKIMMSSK